MENQKVIKHEKFPKFDWVNIIFTSFGLIFIIGGIQRIIDNGMNFNHWFWFIFGVILFLWVFYFQF